MGVYDIVDSDAVFCHCYIFVCISSVLLYKKTIFRWLYWSWGDL